VADKAAFASGRDLPSVAENVELLTGQRGNQLDKAVTYRDLQSLGLATLSRIGSNYKAGINADLISSPTDIQFPVKPLNVIANGAFNTILIEWDDPNYRGHAYAEVFRAGTDNLSVAVKIGTSSANMYSDPIGGSAKVYYWVRFVNRSNPPVAGPYNSESGTYAETAENIQNILDALQGQIEESHLAQSLLTNIELIPALNTSIRQIPLLDVSIQERAAEIQQITVDLSSLTERQSQAEAILKAAQDLLGSTTIDVSLLHDELSQKVLRYGADVQSLRNAILSVDPATGEITIDAINVVRSELQANIDQVTQRVSSVEGTLTQKASSVDVSLQAQRISTVETQMNSINAELTNQVTRAEFTETTEDVTQLTGRMSAAEGSITQKATQQSVDQLGSRVSTAESGLIAVNTDLQSKATQITQIDSAYKAADAANASVAAANSASITQLSQTVSTANTATSQRLSNIDTSVSGLNSSVTQLQQSSSTNAETIASSYEQLKTKADLAALAAANAALSDDESGRVSRVSEASIRKDMTVVANNHKALAQTVEELRANFETTSASLTAQGVNEQTARVTADEALSQTISTLESSYKTADAALSAKASSEEVARVNGDLALSSRVDQVVAATGANSAAIQNESTARANADSAITMLVSTAQAKADSAYSLTQTEITNRASADSALSIKIDTTQASVNGVAASLQSEQTVRAEADASLSSRIDTVAALNGGNSAAIQDEAVVRANEDSALSTRVSTAQAVADSAYAISQTEITNRAAGDAALSSRIDTIHAAVNGVSAAIQSEQAARVAADSAIAGRTDRIEAVIGGDTGNLFINPAFTNDNHGFYGQGVVRYAGYPYMPPGSPAANCLEISARDTIGKSIPVTAGDVYHFSLACATGDLGAPRIGIGASVKNAGGEVISWLLAGSRADASAEWRTISGSIAVPAGAASISLWVQLDYAGGSHWWMITGVQWTNANATRPVSALLLSEQTARIDADSSLSQRIDVSQAKADSAYALAQEEVTNRAAADNALSQRVDTVQATANNLTASVQTQSQAISSLQAGAQAMWTVKGQIADVQAGIGLMVDSSGKSQVMVSASQFFVFDPNSAAPTQSLFAVSDGRVVIQKAAIETATIETVTAMKLTADYVKAGVSISSPVINGGSLSLGNIYMDSGAAGFGKGGPYGGWGFGWNTIIYQDGSLYTNRLYADSGRFNGEVNASSGTFNNVTIAENCNVLGKVYANKLVGDVSSAAVIAKGQTVTVHALSGNKQVSIIAYARYSSNGKQWIRLYVNGGEVDSDFTYNNTPATAIVSYVFYLPSGSSATITLLAEQDRARGLITVNPASTGTFS
jgi:hypothetical protein